MPVQASGRGQVPRDVVEKTIRFYVSPEGKDSWSGHLPEPNAAGTDGPFATLERARDAVRDLKRSARLTGPVVVYLRGGRYPVTGPISFGPEDSGPVTYTAYPGETPVLDGGRRIEGWQRTQLRGQTSWVAELPEVAAGKWYFRSLFVNGQRRPRSRWPKEGLLRIENVPGKEKMAPLFDGSDTFQYAPGDIKRWRNLTDVEIVVPHFWTSERMPIAELDEATRTVRCARRSVFAMTDDYTGQWANYYVENVFEELGTGEWYLDRTEGRLYYIPLPGETPEAVEGVGARTEQFLRLIGSPQEGRFVEFLRFEGLTFEYGDWSLSPGGGEEFVGHVPQVDLGSAPQAAANVPGAIELEGARYCAIENCRILHIGIYGIDIKAGCTSNRIVGNEIYDMGGGGVKLNGADASGPVALRTGLNRITDNHIHAGGRVFHAACGIVSCHAFGNVIAHNHIHDFYYTGISCGWVWGYDDNVSKDNMIEKNHIHHLGHGFLNDMGGIYTLGVQPGTVIRSNLIHDVTAKNYGGWGIYLDAGSSHIVVEGNIAYRTSHQAFHASGGRENVVRHNVLAFGGQGVVRLSWAGDYRSFTLERNLLVADGQPIYAIYAIHRTGFEGHGFASDLNLVWDISGQPVHAVDLLPSASDRAVVSWETLREMGYDLHSVVADPLCRDPRAGDFALAEGSPAWVLGFKPINLSDVGPRPPYARE